MRISIILPAYNEADGLRYCLDSIAAQTEEPYEVIVVDNNSDDDTAVVAVSYPFVTLIHEPSQGIAQATLAGFSHATGDIVARFNADVALDPDWVAQTNTFFMNNSDVGGMTGLANAPLVPRGAINTPLWSWMYSLGIEVYTGIVPLWGGNYAVRAEMARTYSAELSNETNYHDDINLGLSLAYGGERVVRVWSPRVTTSEDSYGYAPKMLKYFAKTINTVTHHKRTQSKRIPSQTRLSVLQRGWRLMVCAVPLTLFMVVSVLTWPLYRLRMKLVQ